MPAPLLSVIQDMYYRDEHVLKDGDKTARVHPTRGVKQDCPLSPLLFSLYINNIDDIAEGVSGAITGTAGVHISHMLYADDLTLLTNEPRDMQIMLSRLAVYARNKHLIVKISKSEVVDFNKENIPVFDVGGATLHHNNSFKYLGMVFYRTLNMASLLNTRPVLFLPLPIGYVDLCVDTLWQTGHTLLYGLLRRMLFLLACVVVKYGVLFFAGRQGVL